MLDKWDKRFLELAQLVGSWSKDPSTKCGAVIVRDRRIISMGFNGFAAGVLDKEARYNMRETKYNMVIHAEENAMLFAKQDLAGCTIYTWPFPPCSNCAAKIIQSGIKTVIAPAPSQELLKRWGKSLTIAKVMYTEAFVAYFEYAEISEPMGRLAFLKSINGEG